MASYVIQELPEGMGNGKSALYPQMQNYSLFDYDKVVNTIYQYSPAFTPGVIRGVLDGLSWALQNILTHGHSAKIDGLGVFSLALGFSDEKGKDAQTKKELKHKDKYRRVCAKGIKFKVDAGLIKEINRHTDFERSQQGVVKSKKVVLSLEERRQHALQLIEQKKYITLNDYACANGLSRSVASRDLKRFTSDPTSGIREKGSHSHKVWVAS
jgi:predicted histone-like DNA-binding protein